jgi:hypothetical protein
MDNATNTNQQGVKHVRFAALAAASRNTDPSNVKSPTAAAEASILSSVASLQKDIATIIEKLSKEHLILLRKLDSKKAILKKLLDNEDVIPRSARIDFGLTGSIRTEQRAEFIALKEETSVMVNNFGKELRNQVIKSIRIEINSIQDELRDHFTTTTRLIAKSYLIAEKKTDNVDTRIYTLMEFFLTSLTVNFPMRMRQFAELY